MVTPGSLEPEETVLVTLEFGVLVQFLEVVAFVLGVQFGRDDVENVLDIEFVNTVKSIHSENDKHCLANSQFLLSWSHYLILMRIKNLEERNFYEIECYNQNWSVRELQRQYNSSLYERLALSRNKDEVMLLSQKGQTIEKPSDIINQETPCS